MPQILEKTETAFYCKIIDILRVAADICYDRIKEIPCINCPTKPEGSMFVMVSDCIKFNFLCITKWMHSEHEILLQVKLIPSLLADINDDMEFCHKLAKEESVIVLPGKNKILKSFMILGRLNS